MNSRKQTPYFSLNVLQMLQLKTAANFISIVRSITSSRAMNKFKNNRKRSTRNIFWLLKIDSTAVAAMKGVRRQRRIRREQTIGREIIANEMKFRSFVSVNYCSWDRNLVCTLLKVSVLLRYDYFQTVSAVFFFVSFSFVSFFFVVQLHYLTPDEQRRATEREKESARAGESLTCVHFFGWRKGKCVQFRLHF